MEKADHLNVDPTFYDRADAHIYLSNSQLSDIKPGKVSASMMYATARFNAYVSWIGFQNGADMAVASQFAERWPLRITSNTGTPYVPEPVLHRRPLGGFAATPPLRDRTGGIAAFHFRLFGRKGTAFPLGDG